MSCCRVLCCVLCCGVSPFGCGPRWLFVCSVVLCHAVGCCCVPRRALDLSSRCFACLVACPLALVRVVVCCAVSLGALPCRVAACCSPLSSVVVLCCLALFGAAARCVVPFGAVCSPRVLCLPALCVALSPRAVCSVPCLFWRDLLVHAVVRCCALLCVRPGLSCCAVPGLSVVCGAALRCAGAVAPFCLFGLCFSRRLVQPCVVVCCVITCGAVLCCCALRRVALWPAVLCCGLLRGWLAALLCGAGCCAVLLSLGPLPPLCCARWCCAAVRCCGVLFCCPVCFLACDGWVSPTLTTAAKFF